MTFNVECLPNLLDDLGSRINFYEDNKYFYIRRWLRLPNTMNGKVMGF